MSSISLGDMAQSVYLSRQNTELKTEMSRLTSELSSGQVQDVIKHLGGDLNYLTDVERSLHLNSVFEHQCRGLPPSESSERNWKLENSSFLSNEFVFVSLRGLVI